MAKKDLIREMETAAISRLLTAIKKNFVQASLKGKLVEDFQTHYFDQYNRLIVFYSLRFEELIESGRLPEDSRHLTWGDIVVKLLERELDERD